MPHRAPRPCAVHGCPELIYPGGECPRHPSTKDRTRETVRASASKRGYDYEWKIDRDAWIRDHSWCADPFGIHQGRRVKAKMVDHKIPRSQGGKDDDSNKQSLCMGCHNYKTAHDGSRRRGRGDKSSAKGGLDRRG